MDRTAYLTASGGGEQLAVRRSCGASCLSTARSATRRPSPSAIVQHREQQPIETTLELVDIIKSAMPPQALREKQHPAKRSFQAIRIAVNGELDCRCRPCWRRPRRA